jgi:Rv0078B-related antitoxin
MAIIRDPAIQRRMQLLFDLYQTAEDMQRMNLRRKYPEASEEELHQRLVAWRQDRPYVERTAKEAAPGDPP